MTCPDCAYGDEDLPARGDDAAIIGLPTSAEGFEAVLSSPDWQRRADLAKVPIDPTRLVPSRLPHWVLVRLAGDSNPWVVAELAVNQVLPAEVVDAALHTPPSQGPGGAFSDAANWELAWEAVAWYQKLNYGQYLRLLAFGGPETSRSLARNRHDHPDWVLMLLVRHVDPMTRELTADRGQELPEAAVRILHTDGVAFVRHAVFRRIGRGCGDVPVDVQEALGRDTAVQAVEARRSSVAVSG